jgi:hypothetical protein
MVTKPRASAGGIDQKKGTSKRYEERWILPAGGICNQHKKIAP